MPIIRHDSPYYTPLSLPMWHVATGISFLAYQFLQWFNYSVRFRYDAYQRFLDLENSCRKSLVQGMQKTAEEIALNSSSEIDTRAFIWTFDCLDEDHELESFFSGLPGFRSSKVVKDPLPSLTEEETLKLYWALNGLLDRTFSSDFLPAHIKDRRALICAKAVDPRLMPFRIEYKPAAFRILDLIFSKYQHSGPVATGIAKILRSWGNNMDEYTIVYTQSILYKVLATSQPRDDSWYNFASDTLEFPETSLREYATQGNSLSLVILTHFVRQQFSHFRKTSLQKCDFSFVLSEASKFDGKDTSSELQHEFCTLWNQIVREAQGSNNRHTANYILRRIRHLFLALHQGTDSAPTHFSASTCNWNVILEVPSSYPLCKVSDHRSDSTLHTHDDGVSATLAHAIPHGADDAAVVPSITIPDPPPSRTHAPLPVFTDALPLDNRISVLTSTQVIGQTTAEGRHIPIISPSPVIEPSRTTQPSMSSPSPKSNMSASPPDDIADGHSVLNRTPLDDLDVRSSPSPTPVLDVILPTGLLSIQTATQSDLSFVYSSNGLWGRR